MGYKHNEKAPKKPKSKPESVSELLDKVPGAVADVEIIPEKASKKNENGPASAEAEPIELGPEMNYRKHLENIKSREVENAEFRNVEFARQSLSSELESLSRLICQPVALEGSFEENLDDWIAKTGLTKEEITAIREKTAKKSKAAEKKEGGAETLEAALKAGPTDQAKAQRLSNKVKREVEKLYLAKLNEAANNEIASISKKTGLSGEAVREIYEAQQETIVAQAKAEIYNSTSWVSRWGLIAGKIGAYTSAGLLAGTSMVATLGVGVGASMSIIGGARIIDRLVTEQLGKKKLDKKVAEIKGNKTESDRADLQSRLAAAVSLKKKIEIANVGLKGDRTEVIDQYLQEKAQAGELELTPDGVMGYKDQVIRALQGLDDIDSLNAKKEEKLNKTSVFSRLKKVEDWVSGKTVREKGVSTAVLVGLGFAAARGLPGVRQVLAGYAGYRLGGAAGDWFVGKMQKDVDMVDTDSIYSMQRKKLLDREFQNSNPEEYLKLQASVHAYENDQIRLNGAGVQKKDNALNKEFKKDLLAYKLFKSGANIVKIGSRVLGALGGVFASNLLTEYQQNRANASHETPAKSSATVEEQPKASTASAQEQHESAQEQPEPSTVPDQHPESGAQGEASSSAANHWEDKISNQGLKSGQTDSVWRSTNQIFKDHAVEMGFKGDIHDQSALNQWAAARTAETINSSAPVTDAVHEGNVVSIEQASDGNYHVNIDQGEAAQGPGFLHHETSVAAGTNHTVPPAVEEFTNKGHQHFEDIINSRPAANPGIAEQATVDHHSGQIHDIAQSAQANGHAVPTEQVSHLAGQNGQGGSSVHETPDLSHKVNQIIENAQAAKPVSSVEALKELAPGASSRVSETLEVTRGSGAMKNVLTFQSADGSTTRIIMNEKLSQGGSLFTVLDSHNQPLGAYKPAGMSESDFLQNKPKVYEQIREVKESLVRQMDPNLMLAKQFKTDIFTDKIKFEATPRMTHGAEAAFQDLDNN